MREDPDDRTAAEGRETDVFLGGIAEAFLARLQNGDSPDPEEYARLHPRQAEEIRELLSAIAEVQNGIARKGSAPPAHDAPLARLGEYRIVREIGRGGMGVVYEAEQERLDRRVALKVLPAHIASEPHFVERFRQEAHAAGRLQHPHIAPVYDVGEAEGVQYFTMQYIDGHSVDRLITEARRELEEDPGASVGVAVSRAFSRLFPDHRLRDASDSARSAGGSVPFPASQSAPGSGYHRAVARMVLQVADALAYAHGRGILHRDIKPSNLLLDSSGKVWVTDFGLCKAEGARTLTQSGDLLGTLRYMSPERFSGRSDVRSDVYALGMTLYEQLTLRPAFVGADQADLIHQIVRTDPPRASSLDPSVPADLDAIARKAMHKAPEARYPTAEAMASDLRAYIEGRPISARAPSVVYLLALAARRHKGVTAALLSTLLTLIVGLVVSIYFATESGARYREVIRLADVKRLADAREDADRLWPAHADLIGDMERWIRERALPLRVRLDGHRRSLASLRDWCGTCHDASDDLDADYARISREGRRKRFHEFGAVAASPGGARRWTREDDEMIWQYDTLLDLIAELERFFDPDPHQGTLASVEERLVVAREIEERSIGGDDARRAWSRAIEDIARLEAYRGLRLVPQMGLRPLRRDPRSGLWEFWDVASGEAPAPDPEPDAVNPWRITGETGIVLVLIPAGTFWMGAQKSDPQGRNHDPHAGTMEGPPRAVHLEAYFISKYEVTQGQWERLTGTNPSYYRAGFETPFYVHSLAHPVEQISWNDAVTILRHLGLVLPTEAQWEYAARGGTDTVWWTGDDAASIPRKSAANLADALSRRRGAPQEWSFEEWDDGWVLHSPVGSFTANGFGLHDVIGNLYEWCLDFHGPCTEPCETGSGLRRPADARFHVYRGGSYSTPAVAARSASRDNDLPDYLDVSLGVRPARRIDP